MADFQEQQTPQTGFFQRVSELVPFDWELIRHASAEPVPYHIKKWWFCLGGTATKNHE